MLKRSFKSILGVTLLEIMLVLAIAAMVIVMSIRYYQSASMSQKVNQTFNSIVTVVAAAETYLSSNGSFTGLGDAAVKGYMPKNTMPTTAWGGQMAIAGATATSYTLNTPAIPTDACPMLTALLQQNSKITPGANCVNLTVSSN